MISSVSRQTALPELLQHPAAAHSQQCHLQELLQVTAVADLGDHVGMVVILQEQEQGELCM